MHLALKGNCAGGLLDCCPALGADAACASCEHRTGGDTAAQPRTHSGGEDDGGDSELGLS